MYYGVKILTLSNGTNFLGFLLIAYLRASKYGLFYSILITHFLNKNLPLQKESWHPEAMQK